jgi:hypothetical protein
MRDAYARSSSPDEQKKIAADIQKEAYDQVIYIPLGQYLAPSAWRKSLSGVLDGPATPVFWNIDKSELSLDLVAIALAQELELLGAFDTFGDNADVADPEPVQ